MFDCSECGVPLAGMDSTDGMCRMCSQRLAKNYSTPVSSEAQREQNAAQAKHQEERVRFILNEYAKGCSFGAPGECATCEDVAVGAITRLFRNAD